MPPEEPAVLLECQWCQYGIRARDRTKICNLCATAIHADCWEAYDKDCPTSHCGAREGWSDGLGNSKATVPLDEDEAKGKKCKRCKGAIRETDVTKICNHCGEVLHTFCWQAGQRLCPTGGCGARDGWVDGKGNVKAGVKLPDRPGSPSATISGKLTGFFRQLLAGGEEAKPKT